MRVRLRLLWHPQAQFAGYLMAEHLGLASRLGVALISVPMDPAVGPVEALLRGDCELAVASPAHVIESATPEKLVLLAAIQQESPLVYPVRTRGSPCSATDLAGQAIAVWPGREDLELRWMLHKAGVNEASVRRVSCADTVTALISGVVSAAQMTAYHELHELEEREGSLSKFTLLRAADHRASLVKDGLIARREWIAANPETMQSVMDSVLEGWTESFRNPARAIAICQRVRPELSVSRQERQLREIRALSLVGATKSHGLGYPDLAHVACAIEAWQAVGGAPVRVAAEALIDATFWSRAPAIWRSRVW